MAAVAANPSSVLDFVDHPAVWWPGLQAVPWRQVLYTGLLTTGEARRVRVYGGWREGETDHSPHCLPTHPPHCPPAPLADLVLVMEVMALRSVTSTEAAIVYTLEVGGRVCAPAPQRVDGHAIGLMRVPATPRPPHADFLTPTPAPHPPAWLQPVLGAGFAYLLLGERWGPLGWVGAGLIVASSALTQARWGRGRGVCAGWVRDESEEAMEVRSPAPARAAHALTRPPPPSTPTHTLLQIYGKEDEEEPLVLPLPSDMGVPRERGPLSSKDQ